MYKYSHHQKAWFGQICSNKGCVFVFRLLLTMCFCQLSDHVRETDSFRTVSKQLEHEIVRKKSISPRLVWEYRRTLYDTDREGTPYTVQKTNCRKYVAQSSLTHAFRSVYSTRLIRRGARARRRCTSATFKTMALWPGCNGRRESELTQPSLSFFKDNEPEEPAVPPDMYYGWAAQRPGTPSAPALASPLSPGTPLSPPPPWIADDVVSAASTSENLYEPLSARRSVQASFSSTLGFQTAPTPGASTCTLDCDAKSSESVAAFASWSQESPKGSWLHGLSEPTTMKHISQRSFQCVFRSTGSMKILS